MSDELLHKCPNPACEEMVGRTLFACRRCWWMLPMGIRHAIRITWKPTAEQQSAPYLASVARARAWYRENGKFKTDIQQGGKGT